MEVLKIKKSLLSVVAIATLSASAFASGFNGQEDKYTVDTGGLSNWTRDKYERSPVCDDTSEAVPRTDMADVKSRIGDLTFSSVSHQGSLGIAKATTLNQICWRYYQQVEDSNDGELKTLMSKFIHDRGAKGRDAIVLVIQYSKKDLSRQRSDVLGAFANGDIQKTKELLSQYIFEQDDFDLMTNFRNTIIDIQQERSKNNVEELKRLIKVKETYKNRTHKSDLVVSFMQYALNGDIKANEVWESILKQVN